MPAATELCVQIPNEPGTLGAVSQVLGRAGINVDGFGVWEDPGIEVFGGPWFFLC